MSRDCVVGEGVKHGAEKIAVQQVVAGLAYLVEEELIACSIAVGNVGSRMRHCNCTINGQRQGLAARHAARPAVICRLGQTLPEAASPWVDFFLRIFYSSEGYISNLLAYLVML